MPESRRERCGRISRGGVVRLGGRKRMLRQSTVRADTYWVRRIRWCFLVAGVLTVTIQDASAWHIRDLFTWLWEQPPELDKSPRADAHVYDITEAYGNDVGSEWLNGSFVDTSEKQRPEGTPERWNSSSCMSRWNMADLQDDVDPKGYLVFSEGREQLGNNRILISDGLVIAKTLNRTLVEFPVKNSRIHTPDAQLGLCDYWDCDELCSYHRILDLQAFRDMLHGDRIGTDDFLRLQFGPKEQSLMPSLATSENIIDFFREYEVAKVIDLNMAWKSGLRRAPVRLIHPNPYYREVVNKLLVLQSWGGGRFIAVQWRTETSKGNLTDCLYRHVLPAVEKRRQELKFSFNQVFFNVDLVGQASTTYTSSVVRANADVVDGITARYPRAFQNFVNKCLQGLTDAGSKAILSGLVSASSRLLLSSSFNGTGNAECQKPHSKYIDLVTEWRLDPAMFGKPSSSIIRLFPETSEEDFARLEAFRLYHYCLRVFVAMMVISGVLMLLLKVKSDVAVRQPTFPSKAHSC